MDRETVEDIRHHVGEAIADVKGDVRALGVLIEDVKSDVRTVAEGLQVLGRRFDVFETNVAREFAETRALVRLSYGELDRRVRDLEGEVSDLRTRLDRLEERLAS
jgi:hypothetical protein